MEVTNIKDGHKRVLSSSGQRELPNVLWYGWILEIWIMKKRLSVSFPV